jgi:hypothetical protein
MERLETDLVTSWHELKRSARPRRRGLKEISRQWRDNKGIARPRRRKNELGATSNTRQSTERDGATTNATLAASNENEVKVRGKMSARWT